MFGDVLSERIAISYRLSLEAGRADGVTGSVTADIEEKLTRQVEYLRRELSINQVMIVDDCC